MTTTVTVRLPMELRAAIEEEAKLDRRTRTSMLRLLLEDGLRQWRRQRAAEPRDDAIVPASRDDALPGRSAQRLSQGAGAVLSVSMAAGLLPTPEEAFDALVARDVGALVAGDNLAEELHRLPAARVVPLTMPVDVLRSLLELQSGDVLDPSGVLGAL